MFECLFCKKPNITDIDQPFCKKCEAENPELDISAAWFAPVWDVESKARRSERYKLEEIRKGTSKIFDPTPAELAETSIDDIIENVEGEGAIEPFKDNPHAQVLDSSVVKQVNTVADILHAKGLKGYDPDDISNARKWIVLTAYMQAEIKDTLTGSQWSNTDWMIEWVNGYLKSKGHKPMSKHTFKRMLREAKIEMEHHGMVKLKEY